MSVFHERLKALRTEKGVLQAEISAALGIKANSYSTYENGREPNYDLLIKMARYFNCTTDFLLGMPDTESRIVEVKADISTYTTDEMISEFRRRIK